MQISKMAGKIDIIISLTMVIVTVSILWICLAAFRETIPDPRPDCITPIYKHTDASGIDHYDLETVKCAGTCRR